MTIRILLIVLIQVALSTSIFADSKYYIGSTTDSNFKFNKKENLILALPQSPSEVENKFVTKLKQYLVDHKFNLVDSIQKADRIMTFRINKNAVMNFESTAHTGWFQNLKTGMPSLQRGTVSTNSKDSGFTFLEISVQDIELIKSKKRSTIWQSFISTKDENFDKYPEVVLDNLMKMYGKNEVKEGKIKKPKR